MGIARDAAGRGLKVILCEKDDLTSHTSSASSKLIHGGLLGLYALDFFYTITWPMMRVWLCLMQSMQKRAVQTYERVKNVQAFSARQTIGP